jgi:hypothetical protein
MWKSAGHAPVFASFTLAFASQLRKKHGKTSVRVRKTPVRLKKSQSEYNLRINSEYSTEYSIHLIFMDPCIVV